MTGSDEHVGLRGMKGSVWVTTVYSANQIEWDLRAFLHQQRLSKAEVDLIVEYGKVSNIPLPVADQWAARWRSGQLLSQYQGGGGQAAFIHQRASQDLLPHIPRWTSVLDVAPATESPAIAPASD